VTAECAVQSGSRGSIPERGWKFFSFTKCPGATQGTGSTLHGAQLVRSEADYRPPSSAKVKNECSYNSSPPYIMTCTRISLRFRKTCAYICAAIFILIHLVVLFYTEYKRSVALTGRRVFYEITFTKYAQELNNEKENKI